ncbi:beta strand repeat-containing protein [Puniceicoccus vermicola]|uniref:Autotransporter-associated beta strand repeat-containing protein n=1 Tax=Puniceicoccus vermicola TaxID=388746 RepID=A0A7X1E5A4_9BACT|nr:autotransporter-associated beta strand repeat-containing protein [Puniceicoccus vermicola]MBC2602976.1 autotransporter-associated beta strand repeat-containing protein [Puniceicoccus vermicola]
MKNAIAITPFLRPSVLLAAFLSSLTVNATDFNWTANGGTAGWAAGANWDQGALIPGVSDNIVGFTNTDGYNAISMGGSRSTNSITVTGATTGSGALAFLSYAANSNLSITSSLTINQANGGYFTLVNGSANGTVFASMGSLNVLQGTANFGVSGNADKFLSSLNVSGATSVSSGAVMNVFSPSATLNSLNVDGTLYVARSGLSGTWGVSATGLSGSGSVAATDTGTGTSGILTINSSSESEFTGVLSNGAAGNTLNLVKSGSGTQILSGDNTYTGTTIVNAGILQINGNQSAATGGVTLNDGAMLAGYGSIGGEVTANSGAIIAAGGNGTAGTLTLANGLNLAASGGAELTFDLGTVSDLILLTGGTLTGNSSGETIVNVLLDEGASLGSYVLLDWTSASALGVDASDFLLGAGGIDGNFSIDGSQLVLNVTSIPEPSTQAIFGLVVLMAAQRLMRRRKV